MSKWSSFSEASQAVENLGTSAIDLQEIAQAHKGLWIQIASHPNAYPSLLEWLSTHGDVLVREAVASRNMPSAVVPTSPPVQQHDAPGKKPTRYYVLLLTLALLAGLSIIFVVFMILGGLSRQDPIPAPTVTVTVFSTPDGTEVPNETKEANEPQATSEVTTDVSTVPENADPLPTELSFFLGRTTLDISGIFNSTPRYGDYYFAGAAVFFIYDSVPLAFYVVDPNYDDGIGPFTGREKVCIVQAGVPAHEAGYTVDGDLPIRVSLKDIESRLNGEMWSDPETGDYLVNPENGMYTYMATLRKDVTINYYWDDRPSPNSLSTMADIWTEC